MAAYWEITAHSAYDMFSTYKYLIVYLVFTTSVLWSGNFFLIAPFPDHCLLVPYTLATMIALEKQQRLTTCQSLFEILGHIHHSPCSYCHANHWETLYAYGYCTIPAAVKSKARNKSFTNQHIFYVEAISLVQNDFHK